LIETAIYYLFHHSTQLVQIPLLFSIVFKILTSPALLLGFSTQVSYACITSSTYTTGTTILLLVI
jgi:hypothetical protein